MMSDFRWLHFSDLHFKQTKNRSDIKELREKLISSLKKLHGQFSDLRYVFITGDIADKGEYDSDTDKWLNLLLDEFEELGVSKENVFWCCGNHDILRKDLKYPQIIRMFVNCVREENPSYEEVMNNPDDRKLILDCKLKAYYDKHQKYLGRTVNPKLQELDEIHFFYALKEFNLIVLNTCVTSLDDEDERNLCIMEARLYDVFRNIDDKKPTFVIGHHGIEFFFSRTIQYGEAWRTLDAICIWKD